MTKGMRLLGGSALALATSGLIAGTVIGTASAASSPYSPGPAAVRKMSVVVTVKNKAGKTIRRETGVAKIVRLGSAAARQAGAPAPDYGVDGPGTVCLAYIRDNDNVYPGNWVEVLFPFPSDPFVVGSMFNETLPNPYAIESVYSAGSTVFVSALNMTSGIQPFDGFYGVLYRSGGC